MTRHRLAQIAEKVNPKSPENRYQTRRFLRNRLLHSRRLPAHRQAVSRSSRTTNYARADTRMVAQEMFCTPHHTFAKEAIGQVRPAARQIIKLLRKWQRRGVSAAGGVMEVK